MTTAKTAAINLNAGDRRGWIFYDGECPLCTASATRFAPLLRPQGFEFVPLQSPWARERLGLKPAEPLVEMKFLGAGGAVFGGADAVLEIARHIWWAQPLYAISFLPGAKPALRLMYGKIAARRNCAGNVCRSDMRPAQKAAFVSDWIAVIFLPIAVWLLTFRNAAWITMWALAVAIAVGFKFAISRRTGRRFGKTSYARNLAFFLWPGMDAEAFFYNNAKVSPVKTLDWFFGILKISFGAAMIWSGASLFIPNHPLIAGWMGMIGLIFLLHFGAFYLFALIYRRFGIAVEPIMRAPILSQSLAQFWGRRWNLAFNKLAFDFGFAPLKRRVGSVGATLAVFVGSGLIHELVISVPARGGYGLPTLYFTIQGIGIVFEHSKLGKRLGFGRGWRGWLFTAALTVGPAFWLFHPVFVRNVILPMLHAIGAI